MPKPTYRVLIPTAPDKLLTLANTILAKHTADDAASPLLMLNMADFAAKLTEANAKQVKALELRRQSEETTEQRNLYLGVAATQNSKTPGTLRYYISGIRELLKGFLRGEERKLGEWGFDVDSGSQAKGFRIPIPVNAVKLITLGGTILTKHTTDGGNSPLQAFDMADMTSLHTDAETANRLALQLRRDSEATTQTRNLLLGIAKGQGRRTKGTLLFYITAIRQVLTGIHRGSEQTLGNWGFEVNTSVSSGGDTEDE